MSGRRTIIVGVGAVTVGLVAASVAVRRHLRLTSPGVQVPGGIVMRDASSYDTLTGVLLGSLFDGIAGNVAATAGPGARVLEVGCGPGHLAARLAMAHGLEVTGLDLDPAMIGRARGRVDSTGPAAHQPTFVVGDVAALPFPDGSFDLVVSTLSMHHWADPAAGLKEIARVLRSDGKALVWDIRPGAVPLHGGLPDPRSTIHGAPLRIVRADPWQWPWRFRLSERIELVPLATDQA